MGDSHVGRCLSWESAFLSVKSERLNTEEWALSSDSRMADSTQKSLWDIPKMNRFPVDVKEILQSIVHPC